MEPATPSTRFVPLSILLILCVAGLWIALSLATEPHAGLCRSVGCSVVLSSQYSHLGRWPIAWFGVGYFSVMIVLWATIVGLEQLLRRIAIQSALALSIMAILVSAVLLGLQVFAIHAYCPFCLASAGLCVGIGITLFYLTHHRDWASQPVAAVAGVLVLVVMAGLFQWRNSEPIVARVGDQVITRQEMDESLGPEGRRLQWETYRQEKNWLEQKLTDMLVKREAAARGMTPAKLVETEVDEPVHQQVRAFMAKHAKEISPGDEPVVRAQMEMRYKSDRAEAFVAGLMRKYHAVEYLEAPAIREKDLAGIPGWHRGGDANTAPIRLVIFSDFGCEYCSQTAKAIDQAFKKYGNEISLTFHYLPLDIHYRAKAAAVAAECAGERGKFWPYHDALMSHDGQLGDVDFVELARRMGLDPNKFRDRLSSKSAEDAVEQSKNEANLLGIDATPAVFLNGRRIGGGLSAMKLDQWITRTLNSGNR